MPSLMTARSYFFRRLWVKVHLIKFAYSGVSIVCNAVWRLTMSCFVPDSGDIRDQVAKLCEIAPKFEVFGEGATQISDRIL